MRGGWKEVLDVSKIRCVDGSGWHSHPVSLRRLARPATGVSESQSAKCDAFVRPYWSRSHMVLLFEFFCMVASGLIILT